MHAESFPMRDILTPTHRHGPRPMSALSRRATLSLVLLPFAAPGYAAMAALADPTLLALLVFHSLTASMLCLLLWYAGLRRVPAATAGVFTAFLPASAAVTAVLFLGESFSAIHAAGFVLMVGSLLLATWPGRTRPGTLPAHAPLDSSQRS